jgi:hypothetical protein
MKKILNEGNQLRNFVSSSASGTVINYGSGSDSDFLTRYGSDPLVKKIRFRFHNASNSSFPGCSHPS